MHCEPGRRFCSSPTSEYVCSDAGFFEELPCPAETPVCGLLARCAVCELGTYRCDDGWNLASCRDDAAGWSVASCPSESGCFRGACLPCDTTCFGPDLFGNCEGDEPRQKACPVGSSCHDGMGCVVCLAQRAPEIWSLNLRQMNHFLIVLSEGEGNGCEGHGLPIPEPSTGDCLVDDLAAGAAYLKDSHGVRTFTVGYRYQGSPEQLLALVTHGGMSFDGYVVAGDEQSLTQALEALFSDPKLCL